MTTDLHPRIFWTADRSGLVEEGDPRAAHLAYGTADPITPEHLELMPGQRTAEPVEPAPRRAATRKPRG
jgi:hypothetical protein